MIKRRKNRGKVYTTCAGRVAFQLIDLMELSFGTLRRLTLIVFGLPVAFACCARFARVDPIAEATNGWRSDRLRDRFGNWKLIGGGLFVCWREPFELQAYLASLLQAFFPFHWLKLSLVFASVL